MASYAWVKRKMISTRFRLTVRETIEWLKMTIVQR